ncbi:hypothetical protein BDN71DRAFT_398254 [Pleurotus eryngii]|uniref:Uncharacterized protein n=1 Tax=Pleurotus eryngii TaxID=5323 RepID=A0A9P6DAQ6_PLEER|nr:hypothetical protein BDN71DRAFT_398254 [Pleurotus eryngii]
MSRNLNCGPRFNSSQYQHAPTTPTLPPTMSHDHSHISASAIAAVKGLWPRDDAQEIIGSDFTSSASSSSAYDNKPEHNDRHEFETSKPSSYGTGTFIQEKALGAWKSYQKNLLVDIPKLNPHASAFVPQLSQPLMVSPSTAPATQLPQWSSTFVRGAHGSREVQSAVANELLDTFPWSLYEISQVAQHFSWMAAVGNPHLAAFAVSVNRALGHRVGELAHGFRKHLELCCHDTFMAFWDMAYTNAITFQTTDASYVSSAIHLTAFIGDLFRMGLLRAEPTMDCLRVLLRNTVSLEHLEAMRSLLMKAGKCLWFTNPLGCAGERRSVELGRLAILQFRNEFRSQTMKMTETSGVLRTPRDGEIREMLYEIVGSLDVWMLPA